MNLHLLPEARACVEQSYFVTGSMRTGTTMFAAIVRSICNVEAFHEPASAYILFPLLNYMEDAVWKILYETCVFEDNFIPAIDGIKLNLSYFDESSIRNSIAEKEIEERLTRAPDHERAALLADKYRIAVKIPEMMPYLEKFKSLYPKITLIMLVRQPASVVSSLIQKGYYSDHRVFKKSKKWPIRITRSGYFLPFWLPEGLEDYWLSSNEVERCCFSYVYQYEQYIPTGSDTIIDYT